MLRDGSAEFLSSVQVERLQGVPYCGSRNAIVHHGRQDVGLHLITRPYSYVDLAHKVRERMDA